VRAITYYVGDGLYWVAAVTVWMISHFPFMEHLS